MKFLTLEQLRDLLNIIPDYDEKHIEYLRDKNHHYAYGIRRIENSGSSSHVC